MCGSGDDDFESATALSRMSRALSSSHLVGGGIYYMRDDAIANVLAGWGVNFIGDHSGASVKWRKPWEADMQ